MGWHPQLSVRSVQVIRQERNEARLEELHRLFYELSHNVIERGIKANQFCNRDDTGFS